MAALQAKRESIPAGDGLKSKIAQAKARIKSYTKQIDMHDTALITAAARQMEALANPASFKDAVHGRKNVWLASEGGF